MSKRYQQEVDDLTEWFTQGLIKLPPLKMSTSDYHRGTDSLTGKYAELRDKAFKEWLEVRHYELSYNQLCTAFFQALDNIDTSELWIVHYQGIYETHAEIGGFFPSREAAIAACTDPQDYIMGPYRMDHVYPREPHTLQLECYAPLANTLWDWENKKWIHADLKRSK